MDYTAMDFWWKVFITLINLGIGVYLFWERHNDGTRRRIDGLETDLDGRMDGHATRLARVEARVEQLPDHNDLAALHSRVTEVAGSVHRLGGEMQGMKTVLNLIHEHLLNGKGK